MKHTKAKRIGVHRPLVQRLREPIAGKTLGDSVCIYQKLDAIGEALAYLIEKKHMKIRVKRQGG